MASFRPMPVPRGCHLCVASALLVAAVLFVEVREADSATLLYKTQEGCAAAIGQNPPYCQGVWSPWFGGSSGGEICSMDVNVYPDSCCAEGDYITDWTASAGQANGITVGGVNIVGINYIAGDCRSSGSFASVPANLGSPQMHLSSDNGFNNVYGRDGLALDQFVANQNSTGGGAWNWSCPQGSKIVGYQAATGYGVVVAIRFVCTNFS